MSSFTWVLSPGFPRELFGEEGCIFLSFEDPGSIDVAVPAPKVLVVPDLGGHLGWNDELSNLRDNGPVVFKGVGPCRTAPFRDLPLAHQLARGGITLFGGVQFPCPLLGAKGVHPCQNCIV